MSNANEPMETEKPVEVDKSKLESDLAKAKKAQQLLPLMILVVGGSTAAQYAGVFSVGSLPSWVGIVIVAILLIQIPFLSQKVNKLERELLS